MKSSTPPELTYCREILEAAQKGDTEARGDYDKVLVTPGVWLMRHGPKAFRWRGGVPADGQRDTVAHAILGPLGAGAGAGAEAASGVLVLVAWGCGAFGNDPRNMADLFIKALDTVFFSGRYDKLLAWLASGAENEAYPTPAFYSEVHFAVPAFRQADEDNVINFRRALEEFVSTKKLGRLETYGELSDFSDLSMI